MIENIIKNKISKETINEINLNKRTAFLVGAFILIAYGVLVYALTESKILVMIADVISGLAVIGIPLLLYPYFKLINNNLAFSYLCLNFIEGGLMIAGGFIYLESSLHYLRFLIYDGIHLYIFIISGFILYYLFYKSKIIPRFISIWGEIAIIALLVTSIVTLFGIQYVLLDMLLLLIISNEIFLAVWLMVKGFNLTEMKYKKQFKNKPLTKIN